MGVVASEVDVIPWHAKKGHELGDGVFVEGKGRCSHEVGVILEA